MQTSSARHLFSHSRDWRYFAFGILFGAALAITGTALAEDDEPAPGHLMQTVWYTLIELAIDTERNATEIVALRERLDDLEEDLAETVGDKN